MWLDVVVVVFSDPLFKEGHPPFTTVTLKTWLMWMITSSDLKNSLNLSLFLKQEMRKLLFQKTANKNKHLFLIWQSFKGVSLRIRLATLSLESTRISPIKYVFFHSEEVCHKLWFPNLYIFATHAVDLRDFKLWNLLNERI